MDRTNSSKKGGAIKAFIILFLIFIPLADSKRIPKIGQAKLTIKIVNKSLYDIFCKIGKIVDVAASGVSSICQGLPPQKSKSPANVVNIVCNTTALILQRLAQILQQFCAKGIQNKDLLAALMSLTTPAMMTLSTPSLPPITLTSSTPSATTPSTTPASTTSMTSTSAPTTRKTTTPAPTTSTQALPTLLNLNALFSTTTTEKPTTPSYCTETQQERCKNKCDVQRTFEFNLGEECTFRDGILRCHCKRVTRCDTYKNATCEERCHNTYKTSDSQPCRIPKTNYNCVCKIRKDNTIYFRLPK